MPYLVNLDIYHGPLDLLLHLIKKNKIDIYNIPVAFITNEYLEHLEVMKALNLDIAGEFLVMASTLMYIKSRMLLPVVSNEEDEAEEDPREQLIHQLLEYQRFKEAAMEMESLNILGRDTFTRKRVEEISNDDSADMSELSVFDLMTAFRDVIKKFPGFKMGEISRETITIKDKMINILNILKGRDKVELTEIIGNLVDKSEVILTFLALLELVKMKVISVVQNLDFSPIIIAPRNIDLFSAAAGNNGY